MIIVPITDLPSLFHYSSISTVSYNMTKTFTFVTVVIVPSDIHIHSIQILSTHKPCLLLLQVYHNCISSLHSFYQSKLCQHLLNLLLSWPNLGLRQLLSLYSSSICWHVCSWCLIFYFSSISQSLLLSPTLSPMPIQVSYSLIPLFNTSGRIFSLYQLP